jgi:hypothetical protein
VSAFGQGPAIQSRPRDPITQMHLMPTAVDADSS